VPERPLALFRVEGVLLKRSALGCAAWMAARHRDLGSRLTGLAAMALTRPLDAVDSAVAAKVAWRALSGCSDDRLYVLGELYREDRLEDAWNAVGLDLLDRCKRRGDRVVLLSDHPDVALGDLATRLGADRLVCNRFVVEDGRATGALAEPVFYGRADGSFVRKLAAELGADPGRVMAYGCHASDATLLSGVALPCAVTPDLRLRGIAATFDWPIVEA
jgi:phosphoserine phosphatase